MWRPSSTAPEISPSSGATTTTTVHYNERGTVRLTSALFLSGDVTPDCPPETRAPCETGDASRPAVTEPPNHRLSGRLSPIYTENDDGGHPREQPRTRTS